MGESKSPVSLDIAFDINDAVNRIGGHVYDVFTESASLEMPEAACAYPGGVSSSDMAALYGVAFSIENYSLEWHMTADSYAPFDEMNYTLQVVWQGVYISHDEHVYECIDNARARVQVEDSGWGWNLNVKATFGNPVPFTVQGSYYPVTAFQLPVDFMVSEREGDGDLWRSVTRGWVIQGNGERQAR